jgi:hypothetical protein
LVSAWSSSCFSIALPKIISFRGCKAGREASMLGDSGPRAAFSCIVTTIFSRADAVRCSSFPRDLDRALSSSSCGDMLRLGLSSVASSSLPLSLEAGEFDNEGTWLWRPTGTSRVGTMALSGCGGQHNVSRAQILQLMFSNRDPSLILCEHLLKTVHMPNRDSTFRGSISCILATSKVRTGAFKRDGIALDDQSSNSHDQFEV